VVAVGRSPGSIGFQGVAQGGAIYAGYFYGSVSIQKRVSDGGGGDLGVAGSKFAVVKGKDGKHRGMYAMESPECWFEDVGKGKLVNGKAEVVLEPLFAQHIHTDDYLVFLTPYSGVGALRVAAQRADGFAVEEIGGVSSGAFSWRVMGKRNDIKNERLPIWDMPTAADVPSAPDAPQPIPPPRPSAAPASSSQGNPPAGGTPTSPVQPAPPPRSG
jgi:hypothetical protein